MKKLTLPSEFICHEYSYYGKIQGDKSGRSLEEFKRMITKAEQRKEMDYLKSVLYVLEREIAKGENAKETLEDDIRVTMKYTWEEGSTESDDWISSEQSVRQLNRGVIATDKTLRAYRRMIGSAYFARVDFEEDGEITPAYLGIATLKDGNEFYIYDWRAPIASPFYDAEIGPASYTLPGGEVIEGRVTLKRQYKIENDQILEIFDTNTQVVDEVLSRLLSVSGSTKMKNIVATIQKEQNRIIRKQDVDILAVQGPAGSGKTSVALHRIAYLLYADKENLNRSNMLILSPNETFSNYISDVLPQMGEDNVFQTTFYEYVQSYLKEFKTKNDMNKVYEELYLGEKTPFYNSIKFKFWPGYIGLLESVLESVKYKLFSIENDIVIDGITLAGAEFLQRFVDNTLAGSDLCLYEQAKIVNEKILSIAGVKLLNHEKTRAKLNKLLISNLKKITAKSVYTELYSSLDKFTAIVQQVYNELGTPKADKLTIKDLKVVFDYTKDCLDKGFLSYEDVMPYLYLKERILGVVEQHNIKQVVIDEAQDYSLIQYKILSRVFRRAKITIVGDINQSLMPFVSYNDYESVIKLFESGRAMARSETQYLTRTYRSTVEINNFASLVLGANVLNSRAQLDRHGEEVKIIQEDDKKFASAKMIKDALELKKKYNTVAIIYKTEKECRELQKALSKHSSKDDFIYMIDGENDFTTKKIMVMPLYIAKGLEFDAVLIPKANEDNYSKQEKKLFYVAVTRAMNELRIYYDDIPSSLIIGKKLGE